jgi:hypothetical protein
MEHNRGLLRSLYLIGIVYGDKKWYVGTMQQIGLFQKTVQT